MRFGISSIKPKQEQSELSYIKERGQKDKGIEQRNRDPQNYYVPYSVEYLNGFNINYYTRNGKYQLALEYEDDKNIKRRLILATIPIKEGTKTISDIKDKMSKMFLAIKRYNFIDSINPESYVASMRKSGWNITNEMLDVLQTNKDDGEVEIKKTDFTQDEKVNITKEAEKENSEEHYLRRERQVIASIEKYIVDSYKGLQGLLPESIQKKRDEILKYAIDKQRGQVDKTELLPAIFTHMCPMEESNARNIIELTYKSGINSYIRSLPTEKRDRTQEKYVDKYLEIRGEYSAQRDSLEAETPEEEKEKLEFPRAKLRKYIEIVDEQVDKKMEAKRVELIEKSEKAQRSEIAK